MDLKQVELDQMEPKFWNIVQRLHSSFRDECERFVVTGSIALCIHGLVDSETISDIDLILYRPSTNLLTKLHGLEDTCPPSNRASSLKGANPDFYRFCTDGVNVDVWIEQRKGATLCYHGIAVSTIPHIIRAKKHLGRSKDYQQIIALATKILS